VAASGPTKRGLVECLLARVVVVCLPDIDSSMTCAARFMGSVRVIAKWIFDDTSEWL